MKRLPYVNVPVPGREGLEQMLDDTLGILSSPPHACVVGGLGFGELPPGRRDECIRRIASLYGQISDNNRFHAQSGVYIDEVKPTAPDGKDVTFTLGACEAHSDESSKEVPEDVVMLWCLRPAARGGDSLIWPAVELEKHLAERDDGAEIVRTLREPEFLFGGRLRNPLRVLRAPILFGNGGIRFRLGSLQDAIEVTGQALSPSQDRAVRALVAALSEVPPYEARLEAGEMMVMLNRQALHARTDFDDPDRLLLRTRCYNEKLSNRAHDMAGWLS